MGINVNNTSSMQGINLTGKVNKKNQIDWPLFLEE